MTSPRWRLRLGALAERDIVQIFLWTRERFGVAQARRYRGLILAAVRALAEGPDRLGTRSLPDIHPDLKVLHMARAGQRGGAAVFNPWEDAAADFRLI